jgi:hypothetical protein
MASITATVTINLDLFEAKLLRDFMGSCYSTDQLVDFWRALSSEDQKMLNNLHNLLKSLGD